MTEADFPLFAAKLIELGEVFDANLTESKQLLYFDALADHDVDFVLGAIRQAVRTCRFFPKPAELRAILVGDEEDHAEEAWMEYKRLAHVEGGYSSPDFQDGALASALVAVFGSWEAACWTDFTPEMWAAKRKEFGRVYRVLRNHGDRDQPARLAGFFERDRALRGELPPPDGLTRFGTS